MRIISVIAGVLPGLTTAQIGAVIILAAFGLAAFAIYAVFQIARERSK